jgi:hypothetical protein
MCSVSIVQFIIKIQYINIKSKKKKKKKKKNSSIVDVMAIRRDFKMELVEKMATLQPIESECLA